MADQAPVIKKIIKKGGGGHHGGSWKVAYADFMAALMAFFLCMWLLTVSQTPEKIKEIAEFYRSTKIFDVEVFKPFIKIPPPEATVNIKTVRELERELKAMLGTRLGSLMNNIVITATSQGLRIELVDILGQPIFEPGKPFLNEKGSLIMSALCRILRKIDNKIVIEGHTDSARLPSPEYTNWDLSTDRAANGRKLLETSGISPKRIFMVAGYADTQPLVKDNKGDPKNRRITLLILTSDKAGQ
jgi:chemotaxis protein MotB